MMARGQHWDNADAHIRAFVHRAVAAFHERISDRLIGAYLHGSLAMGCYRRAKSDLDLLIVVTDRLDEATRRDLALRICDLSDVRPTLGDLELSVVQERYTRNFEHPCPFELHYGSDWKDAIRRGGIDFATERRDCDLAAHFTVTRARGICLFGAPVSDVFGAVPWADYRASVLEDFAWIVEDDHVCESPIYAVLNMCRVLQLLTHGPGTVASKEEGALWALDHLPYAHRPLVQQALDRYQSDREVTDAERRTGGLAWNADALREFRDYAAGAAATRLR